MSDFVFKVDKDVVTEGDVVMVTWACPNAADVCVTLDNGYKSARMDVDSIGSKKFRLNRSKGKTKITLEYTDAKGRRRDDTIKVRVKELPYTKTEEVGGGSKSSLGEWWSKFSNKIKLSWNSMTEKKKIAMIVIWSIMLTLLLSLIHPFFMQIGLMALMFYLAWVLLKK